jgi:hypothetical protein
VDVVGKAIGRQYFEHVNQLLQAAGITAMLLLEIATLSTTGTARAAEVEICLAKINLDLSVGDATLPPGDTPGDSAGPGRPRR